MNLLIDPHLHTWASLVPKRLSKKATDYLFAPYIVKFISAATFWELGYLFDVKREQFATKLAVDKFIRLNVESLGLQVLNIRPEHALAFQNLKLVAGHDDFFDRMLIAQSIASDMPVISADSYFPDYRPELQVIW